jgi:hypothetical protein
MPGPKDCGNLRSVDFHKNFLVRRPTDAARSKKAILTSRREFLSNALGMALVPALTWPTRPGQARFMHGQFDSSPSNTGRTSQKVPLSWDVFLAPSIPAITSDLPPGEKERPWPPISSTLISGERDAVLVDTPLRSSRLAPWRMGCGDRKKSDDDLRPAWPRRSFLWHEYGSGPISRCPLCRAA